MTLEEFLHEARQCGWADDASIRQLARPAVGLRPDGTVGTQPWGSRLGGLPVLPASMPWPKRNGRSLGFIAQVDLATRPKGLIDLGLPTDGLLLFFYDVEQTAWGFDPKDIGSFAVIYLPHPSSATLVDEWPPDVPVDARYRSCALVTEEVWSLPPWESVLIEDLNLDRQQLDSYQDVLERLSGDDAWAARALLGGHPDQIQGDMTLECAMVSAGLYCGDATAYEDPRLPQFRRDARQWRLLLQVPSAEDAGMMWGDTGCLYYWIREDDLKTRNFERSWMILQCG